MRTEEKPKEMEQEEQERLGKVQNWDVGTYKNALAW